MRYRGTIIRPPSEAESYILQVTYGCSYNRCTFCPTYLDKPFSVRPAEEVREDIELARRVLPGMRRVFLADGNALVLSNRRLLPILSTLREAFPRLARIGAYANAQDILRRTPEELSYLREARLSIIYIGLESGDDVVLEQVKKGATAGEMIEAVRRAQSAGMKVSVIGLLGLGGAERSREHALATARAVDAMSPRYFSLLTLMIVPGTELHEQQRRGAFVLPSPLDLLGEMRIVIDHLTDLGGTIFRTNHASNYLALAGTLSRDRERLLARIDDCLARGPRALRPEQARGL